MPRSMVGAGDAGLISPVENSGRLTSGFGTAGESLAVAKLGNETVGSNQKKSVSLIRRNWATRAGMRLAERFAHDSTRWWDARYGIARSGLGSDAKVFERKSSKVDSCVARLARLSRLVESAVERSVDPCHVAVSGGAFVDNWPVMPRFCHVRRVANTYVAASIPGRPAVSGTRK